MILRGYNLGTLGWGAAPAPASGRVIYVDPNNKPAWMPAGATIIYRTPTAAPPAPAAVAVQPLPAAQPSLPELIPTYSSAPSQSSGLQRPVEIPIEQTFKETVSPTATPEGGSLVPIIIAIIAAIVAGQ